MVDIPTDYYGTIAELESSNNPDAYNSSSGATGLYQFLPSTWKSLGLPADTITSESAQQSAIQTLTTQNANVLAGNGISINDTSLYAAHVLGAGRASEVLGADPSTSLASIIGTKAASLNKWLGTTAGSAVAAIGGKVSAAGNAAASVGNSASALASQTVSGSGILQMLQNWIDASGFFTRIALGIFAIVILVAAFAMLKPVQSAVATGVKAAA